MGKGYHYMTERERYKLEGMLDARKPVAWIARELGFSRKTIYNEIRRGSYWHTLDYKDELRYSAAKAQDVHRRAQKNKGRPLKIGNDIAYANFLEEKVLRDRYSPAAALAAAKAAGFKTSICRVTFYSYIEKRVFYQLTNSDLWIKSKKKKKKKQEPRIPHPDLPSIEQRPPEIRRRTEFGHWEMDLVVGCKKSKAALLTMTERTSRLEIIRKLPDKKAATVRKAINKIERETPGFREIFKSITTDNGSEFLEHDKLIRSVHGGRRFDVWYCHSYAAWEKGTNENHNRMIRRFFPKGTNFDKVSKKEVAALQDWMNGYPRKILGWKTPGQAAASAMGPAAAEASTAGPLSRL